MGSCDIVFLKPCISICHGNTMKMHKSATIDEFNLVKLKIYSDKT